MHRNHKSPSVTPGPARFAAIVMLGAAAIAMPTGLLAPSSAAATFDALSIPDTPKDTANKISSVPILLKNKHGSIVILDATCIRPANCPLGDNPADIEMIRVYHNDRSEVLELVPAFPNTTGPTGDSKTCAVPRTCGGREKGAASPTSHEDE